MLKKVPEIERLDKNSDEYRKACYELASHNHYFEMPTPPQQSKELREDYISSLFFEQNIRNKKAATQFYKNEMLRNIDTKSTLAKLKTETKILAIYGKQDGIFSPKQLQDLKNIVTLENFALIDNRSTPLAPTSLLNRIFSPPQG